MTDVLTHKLAWLAGIVDGEGTITYWVAASTYTRKDNHRSKYLRLNVSVANTNATLIREIKDISTDLNIPFKVNCQYRSKAGHKDCWYISWQGALRVKAILTALMPWLIAKKPQAELILSVIEQRQSTRSRTQVPVESDVWLNTQLQSITALNKRGVA